MGTSTRNSERANGMESMTVTSIRRSGVHAFLGRLTDPNTFRGPMISGYEVDGATITGLGVRISGTSFTTRPTLLRGRQSKSLYASTNAMEDSTTPISSHLCIKIDVLREVGEIFGAEGPLIVDEAYRNRGLEEAMIAGHAFWGFRNGAENIYVPDIIGYDVLESFQSPQWSEGEHDIGMIIHGHQSAPDARRHNQAGEIRAEKSRPRRRTC